MKNILLFGAGKSATCLIEYLLTELKNNAWHLTVCDVDVELARSKTLNAENTIITSINVENDAERKELIILSDVVISMLPPSLHYLIAKDCVKFSKHLLTASYVDENIRSLEKEIKDKKLFFLCEMGLDPGIDHMSAMKMINSIKEKGGIIKSFVSHCGGLIAPESDDNPWHYKITWNPRNIILAGKDGAEYLEENEKIKIPYRNIFKNCPPLDVIEDYPLCWYPNRDSLHYIDLYKLHGISTFTRTTLRHPAFCKGWNELINMGLTDTDDYETIKNCLTFKEWFELKSKNIPTDNYLDKNEFINQVNYLGLESDEQFPFSYKSSADILQHLLEKKLGIKPGDKDMIVMRHEIKYTVNGQLSTVNSSLIVKGENSLKTAMSKTVGLPLGIATKLLLQNKIHISGLHIPVIPEIYEPVLDELEKNGIVFKETNLLGSRT